MNAGRELDAMIAEKVMGVEVNWREIRRTEAAGGNYRELVGTPRYSTDIAAAWEVVTRFANERYYVRLELDADGVWWAQIGSAEDAPAKSPPLAICLAALKAMEAK